MKWNQDKTHLTVNALYSLGIQVCPPKNLFQTLTFIQDNQ